MHAPVSVIIPCYNASDFLERAVNSVLNQTLPPQEVIFVDDASPDDGQTKVAIKNLQEKILEKNIGISVASYFLSVNVGPGIARNFGWEQATQPWLAFLDADDAWHRNKLQVQWGWIESHSNVDLVGHLSKNFSISDDMLFSPEGLSLLTIVAHGPISLLDMLISNRFLTRTVMLRRDISLRFRGRRYAEDYLLWLEILLSGYCGYVLKQNLAFSYRPEYAPGGQSGNLWLHEKSELGIWIFLYKTKKIPLMALAIALPWSFLKYLKRNLRVIKNEH
jgi:glycosyltransferase involved in cell wall biosynthesis